MALVAAVLTAMVVVTPVAFRGLAGVWDQFRPGPSVSEQEQQRYLESVQGRSFWRITPRVPSTAQSYLAGDWDRLNPYRPHRFDTTAATDATITDLLVDHRLNGHTVKFWGYVGVIHWFPGDLPGTISQSYQVATTAGQVWCSTTSRRGSQVVEGEHIEVVGTVVTRGVSQGGDYLAVLVCPALRRVQFSAAEKEVNEYYDGVRGNFMWDGEPGMSETSRKFLVRSWSETSPYRRHKFIGGYPSPSVAGLFENSLFDGRLVEMSGYADAVQTLDTVEGRDLATQAFSLVDGATAARCVGVRPVTRQVREGDAVAFTGVAVARGISGLSGGGFQRIAWVACNNIYLFP